MSPDAIAEKGLHGVMLLPEGISKEQKERYAAFEVAVRDFLSGKSPHTEESIRELVDTINSDANYIAVFGNALNSALNEAPDDRCDEIAAEAKEILLNREFSHKIWFKPPHVLNYDRFGRKVTCSLEKEYSMLETFYAIDPEHVAKPTTMLFNPLTGSIAGYLMEYVEGVPLSKWVPKDDSQAMDVAHQIISFTKKLQERGLAHLDLQENNIMVTRNGVIKVIDPYGVVEVDGKPAHEDNNNNKDFWETALRNDREYAAGHCFSIIASMLTEEDARRSEKLHEDTSALQGNGAPKEASAYLLTEIRELRAQESAAQNRKEEAFRKFMDEEGIADWL